MGVTMQRLVVLMMGWLAAVPVLGGVNDLGVTAEIRAAVEQELGAAAASRLDAWRELVVANMDATESEKLARVNAFFNTSTGQAADSAQWNAQDYWASPLQFVARGAGDSEDGAIAKFFTLTALGVPEEKLRMAYTRATFQGNTFAHMVLIYRSAAVQPPLVLDNIQTPVLPLTERPELRVVYEFNSTGLYVPRADGEKRVSDVTRLGNWTSMLERKAAGQF